MTAKEIIESGLLELYAIGQLEGPELVMIEKALIEHSSVRQELLEIESALNKFASIYGVDASDSILDRAIEQIESSPIHKTDSTSSSTLKNNKPPMWQWIVPLIGLVGASLLYISERNANQALQQELNRTVQECEEAKENHANQSAIYAAILDINNRIIEVSPTEKYPNTKLSIHVNEVDGTNYLQIKDLPEISGDLAFQLWSLKGNNAPIPLTVFSDNGSLIIPIDFEPDTDAYAITIEQAGGAQSPNLEELIGVFSLG